MNSEVCVLDDGRRVRFSLKMRGRDPYYLASFRGPDGQRKERSTREANKKRAIDAAVVLVKEAYSPQVEAPANPSWDEAIGAMARQMGADNLRPKTIEQYVIVLRTLRRCFPEAHGPGEITAAMATRFKAMRLKEGRWGRPVSIRTLRGNLDNLNIVYNKWLIGECRLLAENPFAEVGVPKADRPSPRLLLPQEVQDFFDWMSGRWDGWRLPILFLETKRLVGCRITELASAATADLREGRLVLPADVTKGRKERGMRLPGPLFEELRSAAGPRFVWEAFPEQLRRAYLDRGRDRWAGRVQPEFRPERLKKWLEREMRAYRRRNPGARRFKLHNRRGDAMSRAKAAGISYEDAAVAFGCNPETMRKHYVALDELAVSDRVMQAIQGIQGRLEEMARSGDLTGGPDSGARPVEAAGDRTTPTGGDGLGSGVGRGEN